MVFWYFKNLMKEFIKIGVIYSLVKYIIMGLGVIKSFYAASALGPTILGSFAVIMLIVEYLNYLNLGVFASMNRDVAIHMEEQKKKEYVDDIINTALSFTIIPIAIITLSFLLIEFIEFSFISSELKEYSWIILILVAFNQLKIFLLRYLRLYSKYYELTILEFLTQIMNLTGVVLFVGEYSIDAVIWSVLISTIFFNIVAFIYVKRFRFQINYSLVKYLIVSGLPMLFYALTLTLLSSIDRMVIAASFESRALGLYHLGFISAQGLFMAFNSIALLFYPRWLKYFHEQDSQNKFNSIKEQTLMIELILVCLSCWYLFNSAVCQSTFT
jgi:O-antigen/teichoic acid export membrane protein